MRRPIVATGGASNANGGSNGVGLVDVTDTCSPNCGGTASNEAGGGGFNQGGEGTLTVMGTGGSGSSGSDAEDGGDTNLSTHVKVIR
ncbi:MAG: hypothetical protein AB8B69_24205 [Chitinophagales bacterium]